ncbi:MULTISPECIES: hypothetical protein [Acetobacter]|uniref:Uncharacterized protein n=2 Tax=Acetobacter TaxID=434 RepID=A0AAN1PFE0_9PROT|nr:MULTISPECIES: hypothetical protein [Acetobacter]ASL41508.1 hypothetical protein CBI36_14715 [Acetobacter oryzifermentans]AXC25883.1 hypothetical protein DS739_03190 [Acetobacter sp. JWB]AXC27573.1 hypothetical protein DS739_13045 [Acetobacter sp. JWB]AXM99170.1 hypothetical protein CJF59_00220 [Acetobacter pomorum]KAA8395645.1 hypothetical protein FKW19_10115 [Acetobacter sp. DmW_125128]
MTETRAPFNGKKKDPIGVFVRLHDGMLNEKQIAALCNPKRSSTENILTIGTPVTGGEMDYYAQIIWFEDAPEPEIVAWRNRDIKKGDNVKVVRQSDALAKLVERDAEIARLNQKITKLKDIIAGAMIQSCLHGADGDIGRLRRVEAELEAVNALNRSEGMSRENCP